MRRYAEDSLDARIRQAQEKEQQVSPSMLHDSQIYADQSQQSAYSSINPNQFKNKVGSAISSQSNLVAYMNRDQASMFQTETAPRNYMQEQPVSDPRMNKTNGSNSGSFAYTSSKHVPKYSPVRNPKPGQANTPMTYAGPPNKEELNRNAKRPENGNRNFNQVVEQPNLQAQNRPRPQTAKNVQKRPTKKQVKQEKAAADIYMQQQIET